MNVKEKITSKELRVKALLTELKNHLNNQSVSYAKNSQDFTYLISLSFTESKLMEILEFIRKDD